MSNLDPVMAECHPAVRARTPGQGECWSCWRARKMADPVWKARDVANRQGRREYLRNYQLLRLCGITLDEFRAAIRGQGGKCPICLTDIDEYGSHADHNHETDEFRGVLCGKCNRAIGMLNEDVPTLQRAAAYLLEGARV